MTDQEKRIKWIDKALRSSKGLRVSDYLNRFNVTRRTFARDLIVIKKMGGGEWDFNHRTFARRYSNKNQPPITGHHVCKCCGKRFIVQGPVYCSRECYQQAKRVK